MPSKAAGKALKGLSTKGEAIGPGRGGGRSHAPTHTPPAQAEPLPSRKLPMPVATDGDEEKAQASAVLSPTFKAAALMESLTRPVFGAIDLGGTVRALNELVAQVQGGDMAQADAMMVAEAYTLDALFMNLLVRWQTNITHSHEISESYLRLAMKAQAQARSTWESLSRVKNPPQATFIRQANLANGPQQVNNGARTPEIGNQPNELEG